jgi:dihydroorotate dehydrogenase (NAD+) catalytic subunit
LSKLSLAIDISGLSLESPLMNAAGILGITTDLLRRVYESGAGAVVTKSIGLFPREGHKNPTFLELDGGALNAMGLPNPGVDYFSGMMGEMDFPVVASFFGSSLEEFIKIAKILSSSGAAALELNASCPNVLEEMGMLAEDPQSLELVTSKVRGSTSLPLFVKLSPNVTDIVEVAKAAERGGADAITATNTLKAIAISHELKRPILSNITGGLSGSALKPVSLRCVWEIYDVVEIPVIGCGGISSWRDAVEYMLAGASVLEIGTAIMTEGFTVFQKIKEGLHSFMENNGYQNIEDLVGVAHET